MASFRVAASVVACLVLVAPPDARALGFSSSVERFEADGNVYGSADGVFDLIDEFDDGVLAPNWAPLLGTALESGGRLTLTSPGITVPLLGLPQEISAVESAAELQNGEGSFTITSYWDPTPLPENRQFFFQLYGITPGGVPVIEASGITVNHFDAATAAGAGAPAGWSIGRQRFFASGSQEPPVQDYVAIDPLELTGPIVLRLSFDDATDLLTASFSLDGGTTFQSPFAPLQAFELLSEAEVLLGAAAVPASTIPPCAGISSLKATFKRLHLPAGRQTVRATGDVVSPFALVDPVQYGVALRGRLGHRGRRSPTRRLLVRWAPCPADRTMAGRFRTGVESTCTSTAPVCCRPTASPPPTGSRN